MDADLSKYFDSIPHSELMQCVARRIVDGAMLHLIKMWLSVPAEEREDKGNRRMTGGQGKGTPQGGVMTPRTQKITSNLTGGWDSGVNQVRIDSCHRRLYVYDRCHAPARFRRPNASIAHATCCCISINSPTQPSRLAQDCSISPRQAYRYLEQAQRLREPLPLSEAKLAFTVKLPHSLVQRVRTFAAAKGLSISEVVSRALLALLPRGRGRG